jgi:ethanolamine ammonia-lyase small subunit
LSPARIALGRTGASLPTSAMLSFELAHAVAHDAVYADFDSKAMAATLSRLGLDSIELESEATDRSVYLRRPDFGRLLSPSSQAKLAAFATSSCDLSIVVADGLSAEAVSSVAPECLAALLPHLQSMKRKLSPVAIVSGARVAIGDAVGAAFRAQAVLVLIGERPGLSSPRSLGAYLTYWPHVGRQDFERNCVSNIRPDGLDPAAAARKLAWLIDAALSRRLTGVALKDESDQVLIGTTR